MKLSPGLVVEKIDGKSRNSTPDSRISNVVCFICRSSGILTVCRECTTSYHSSCASPSSSVSCPNCKHKKTSQDEASSEDSSKEEFVSKCPNVAESYNKLKKYIEHHTDSDAAALYIERENYKMELIIKNQELYEEKHKLEEKAAELSEALLMQEDSRNELLKEEENVLAKIKVIVDFVKIFQKTNEPKPSEGDDKANEEASGEAGEGGGADEETPRELKIEIDEVKMEEVKDSLSPPSPTSQESLDNYENVSQSPPRLIQETESQSVKDEDMKSSGSPSSLSKESIFADAGATEMSASPPSVNSKDSASNPLFELDEGEDQLTSQSVEKSSVESDVIEYETPSSEPEFY